MKHLVISVSKDSSLELLGKYADVIVLDKDSLPTTLKDYKSVYIRSHFSTPELIPQKYRVEIEHLVRLAVAQNPMVEFIDNMSTVDEIVSFEDKWQQYEVFTEFMPATMLLSNAGVADFARPIYKKRLSSRGKGVTWNEDEVVGALEDWIVQESLDIVEEIRIYVIKNRVYDIGAIRYSMTDEQKTHPVDSRKLNLDEIQFAAKVSSKVPELDFIGLDIARTADNELFLMEVNRSPGFGSFEKLTGENLADNIYK